jgi:hypothetical protein
VKVKKWTGGCVDGKRDGKGTYRTFSTLDYPGVIRTGSENESEGTLVSGVPVGLWCSKSDIYGRRHAIVCALSDGKLFSAIRFLKDDHGGWQLLPRDANALSIALPAGSLEAESDQMIAAVRAGAPAGPLRVSVSAPALANLTQGASIRVGLSPREIHIDLHGKRVALVYSDATLAAMKQFPLDVQTAVGASSVPSERFASFRRDFIASATVTRFAQAIGAPLLRKGIILVPASDLSVLSKGEADYALLVDWHYTWRSNLTEIDYDAMPVCENSSKDRCDTIYKQSVSLYLIGRGPELLKLHTADDSVTKISESAFEGDLILRLNGHFGDTGLFNPTRGSLAISVARFADGL